jgi:hypothetical protein
MAPKKVGDGAGSGTGNGGDSGIGDGFISGGGDGAGSGVDGPGFGLGDGYISKCVISFTNYRILCMGETISRLSHTCDYYFNLE